MLEDKENSANNDINLENDISKSRSSLFIHDESVFSSFFSNEENKQSLDASIISQKKQINFNELKIGSKIRCCEEKCFSNAIISIEPHFFQVNSDCGKHKKKMDIFSYVFSSGSLKDDQEQCNYCNKNYQDLKKGKLKLYKITCEKNICENCKKNHEKEISNHNLIDIEEKDYTCNCSKGGNKYINYCFDCQQNVCIKCIQNHKDHEEKKFSSIYQIGKEKINKLKKQLKGQKKALKDFNSIIEDWIKRTIEAFNKYKKKIELYIQINEKIIDNYNSSKRFYKAIKNIEYINFDLDNFILDINVSKNNYKAQNNLICRFLNDNIKNHMELSIEENINDIQERNEENLFNGPVKNICELKKEELVVVNINNKDNNNEELYIYKKETDFKEIYHSKIEEDEILCLSELKNGNLLIVQKNKFKIFNISKNSKSIINVQIEDISEKDYSFNEIFQLKNGYLISLLMHPNQNNKIFFWEKNLMTGKYEIIKRKENENSKNAISMIEIDKFCFLVLDVNNNIIIYNSNTFQDKKIGHFINVNKEFQKMVKIGEDGLLIAYKDLIILYNLYTFQVKREIIPTILDIINVPNSYIYFLATCYERNNNLNGIYLIKCNLIENYLQIKKLPNDFHTDIINCIYPLSNGDIISCSSDSKVKIFKLKRE